MSKRFLALLAALCLLFLTACGQPTAAPTTEATVAPTTEATQPATEAPVRTVPLHSGIREDGTFDEGTLFIGDSLTNGFIFDNLMLYNRIGDAKYMAIVGAPVQAYFDGPHFHADIVGIYSHIFRNMIMSQGVEMIGSEITAVYFMLGSNYSVYTTYETYEKIVEHLLEYCPNATIYLQKIPYSFSDTVEYELVNGILEELYQHYATSVDTRVMLIDTFSAIGDQLVGDGIHVHPDGQQEWYKTLLEFAEENNIPQ